jgi:UDP-N-acetylglucosamine/UDP-N-acetylgalactosamine diphosphorylase
VGAFLVEGVKAYEELGKGEDDPDTSKRDIMAQGRRWAEAAGAVVTDEGDAAGVEISPLMSYVSHG